MTTAEERVSVPAGSMRGDPRLYLVGASAAIVGVVINAARQAFDWFHPASEPANPPAAFADYANHQYWVLAHLLEFLGWALIISALIILSWRIRGRAEGWAVLARAGAVMTLTLMAALQAVDGVTLKVMVDRWAGATAESRELLFEGAYAVRQIEGGLLAMFVLSLGLTVLVYGVALTIDEEAPNWLGMLGIAAAPMTVALAVALALDPFGETTGHSGVLGLVFGLGVLGNLLVAVWIVLVGRFLFQISRREAVAARAARGDKAEPRYNAR